jgi:hypothetical protein
MENFTQWMRNLFFHRICMIRKLVAATALLAIALLPFLGCDHDSGKPSAEKQYLQKLSSTWNLQQVRFNGTDVTSAFNGITLTLKGDQTFIVTNPVEPVWPANGTFVLKGISGASDHNILRSDGTLLQVSELSSSALKLQMPYRPNQGRWSVSGKYEFIFAR